MAEAITADIVTDIESVDDATPPSEPDDSTMSHSSSPERSASHVSFLVRERERLTASIAEATSAAMLAVSDDADEDEILESLRSKLVSTLRNKNLMYMFDDKPVEKIIDKRRTRLRMTTSRGDEWLALRVQWKSKHPLVARAALDMILEGKAVVSRTPKDRGIEAPVQHKVLGKLVAKFLHEETPQTVAEIKQRGLEMSLGDLFTAISCESRYIMEEKRKCGEEIDDDAIVAMHGGTDRIVGHTVASMGTGVLFNDAGRPIVLQAAANIKERVDAALRQAPKKKPRAQNAGATLLPPATHAA